MFKSYLCVMYAASVTLGLEAKCAITVGGLALLDPSLKENEEKTGVKLCSHAHGTLCTVSNKSRLILQFFFILIIKHKWMYN